MRQSRGTRPWWPDPQASSDPRERPACIQEGAQPAQLAGMSAGAHIMGPRAIPVKPRETTLEKQRPVRPLVGVCRHILRGSIAPAFVMGSCAVSTQMIMSPSAAVHSNDKITEGYRFTQMKRSPRCPASFRWIWQTVEYAVVGATPEGTIARCVGRVKGVRAKRPLTRPSTWLQ